VHIRQAALGKERGTVDLFFGDEGTSTASLHRVEADVGGRSESVEMTTIDEFCRESGIEYVDFLKIDTEGHEIDVLLGANQMIEAGRIAAIQFEFGDTFLHTKYHFHDVFNMLSPRHTIYRILRSGLIEVPRYTHDLEIFKLANFLCIRKGHRAGPPLPTC
jgi:Methyltransferase FkbM domain